MNMQSIDLIFCAFPVWLLTTKKHMKYSTDAASGDASQVGCDSAVPFALTRLLKRCFCFQHGINVRMFCVFAAIRPDSGR